MYELFFDGGKKDDHISYGIVIKRGKTLIYNTGNHIKNKHITSNIAEFIALIVGLYIANCYGIKRLTVYGDSKSVIHQMNGTQKSKHYTNQFCYQVAKKLEENFEYIRYIWIQRSMNKLAHRETR